MAARKKKVLVIDDIDDDIRIIEKGLKPFDYEVLKAKTGEEGLKIAKVEQPDVILLDIMMPGMDGYKVCEELRSDYATRDIPILFVSAKVETSDIIEGFQRGGDDYITKPFSLQELAARVNAAMRIKERQDNLKMMSITDELTGLYNRRYLNERLTEEIERARRYKYPISCLMLDLDHFKDVNDTYGHQVGDLVLEEFARILKNSTRVVDIVARYGGEEFLIVLPMTNLKGAQTLAERVRRNVELYRFAKDLSLPVTVSIGCAQLDPTRGDEMDAESLIKLADKALYEAKKKRNAIACA
ncbi:TPA: diguanylate cyclase [Candidatus Poribacteria bacterium]|nr:diguanylate cyclase [Candidatus Poribacteria bacterium]